MALVPGPGHSKADRSLSLRLVGERVIWHSFANDTARAVFDHLGIDGAKEASPQERREAARQREAEERRRQAANAAFCAAVWGETLLSEGTIVAAYLAARGLSGAIPHTLRFHAAAPTNYQRSVTTPAMVALVHAPNGQPVGLHVTALKADGSAKAWGDKSRRMFGSMRGAAVRLGPISEAGELAVGEGIESCLSFSTLKGVPAWAALSTSGLQQFGPPASLTRLYVAADADDAGMSAARELAERASRLCEVVVTPPAAGDWNDALMEGAR